MERNPATTKKSLGKTSPGGNAVQRISQLKRTQQFDYAEQLEEIIPEPGFQTYDKPQLSALYNSLCVFSDVLSELDTNLNMLDSKVDILINQVGIYQEPEKMVGEIKGSGYEKELNLNDLI